MIYLAAYVVVAIIVALAIGRMVQELPTKGDDNDSQS